MKKINNKITDIRNKIIDICSNIDSIKIDTVQFALAAFTWNLLDSYIAWRMTRFVLKDIIISDDVSEKWYSTPSSYNVNDLVRVWRFSKKILDDISEQECGNPFTNVIKEITDNRNAVAHFKEEIQNIKGSDVEQKINKYFKFLDKVFFIYELNASLNEICSGAQVAIQIETFAVDENKNKLKNIYSGKFRDEKVERDAIVNKACINEIYSGLPLFELKEKHCFKISDNDKTFNLANTKINIFIDGTENVFTNGYSMRNEMCFTFDNGFLIKRKKLI